MDACKTEIIESEEMEEVSVGATEASKQNPSITRVFMPTPLTTLPRQRQLLQGDWKLSATPRNDKSSQPHTGTVSPIPEETKWNQVKFFNAKAPRETYQAVQRLIQRHNDRNQLAKNLIFILQNLKDPAKRRQLVQVFKDCLSPIDQDVFVTELLHSRAIHESYVHALNLISHYRLSGEIIIDQLRMSNPSTAIGVYLAATPTQEVSKAVALLASLAEQTPLHIRTSLRDMQGLFPEHYLEGDNLHKIFEPMRIVRLAGDLCTSKELAVPTEIRDLHMRVFFDFILGELQSQKATTDDFINMVLTTIYRLNIDPKVAIQFFGGKADAIAEYLAYKFETKTTPTEPTHDWTPSHPCINHDKATDDATDRLNRHVVIDKFARLKMVDEIGKAEVIAILHHEPPLLLPDAPRIDMLSIRANAHFFHIILQSHRPAVTAIMDALKNATRNRPLFGRNPATLVAFLQEKYGWSPEIHNITPYVQRCSGGEIPSMNTIADMAYGGRTCLKASVFSAHITPSPEALRHREQVLSAIFLFSEANAHRILGEEKEKQDSGASDWDRDLDEARESTPPTIPVEPESRRRPPACEATRVLDDAYYEMDASDEPESHRSKTRRVESRRSPAAYARKRSPSRSPSPRRKRRRDPSSEDDARASTHSRTRTSDRPSEGRARYHRQRSVSREDPRPKKGRGSVRM